MTAPSRLDQPLAPVREALDTETMSTRLAGFLNQHAQLRVVAAELVGSASVARVVVAYETAGPGGSGPTLIGKVFADGARAGRVYDLLVELDALDRAGHQCGVPRPVAHLPELGMCVYVAAEGRPLDQLHGRGRHQAVVAAAGWLAAMHGLEIHLDRRLDMAVESRNLKEWARLVARLHPSVAETSARLLEELVSNSERIRVSTAATIHKDFQYRHVLVDRGRVTVIDLDEARAGDPAFDVGHFIANLRLLAIREGQANEERARLESAFPGLLRLAHRLPTGSAPRLLPGLHLPQDRQAARPRARTGAGADWFRAVEAAGADPVGGAAMPAGVRVAYVVRSWPRLSQTFILNEILNLERIGVGISIFAIARADEPLVQAEVAEVTAPVHYLDQPSRQRARTHLRLALASPRRYLATLAFALTGRHLLGATPRAPRSRHSTPRC